MGNAASLEDTIKAKQMEHPNAHFMLVDGMSNLMNRKVPDFVSSDFQVFGLKWYLNIRPAEVDSTEDYISFFLNLTDTEYSLGSNLKVKCSFKLSVVAPTPFDIDHSTEWLLGDFEGEEGLGVASFISYSQLNKYILEDKALFCAEISYVQPNLPVPLIYRPKGTAEHVKMIEVSRNNSRFTWKITQFSSFNSKSHSSYEFTVGPRRWKLVMFPKGHGDGEGNSLSLYLNATDFVNNGPKTTTLAVYKLRVLDQLHRKHFEKDFDCWFGYNPDHSLSLTIGGDDKFMPLGILKDPSRGFLVKDQIYVGVEFLLVSTTKHFY